MYFFRRPSAPRYSQGIFTTNVCSRAFGLALLKSHGILRLHNEASRSRRTRRRRSRGSASCFFPNVGVLEKDAPFRTDIFESKVLQWRSETFLRSFKEALPQRAATPGYHRRYFNAENISVLALYRRAVIPRGCTYISGKYRLARKSRGRTAETTRGLSRSYAAIAHLLISGTREPPSSPKLCLHGLALLPSGAVRGHVNAHRGKAFHSVGFAGESTVIKNVVSLVDHVTGCACDTTREESRA